MKKVLVITSVAISLALSGCTPHIHLRNDVYQEVSMQKADLMPTNEALNGEQEKIVIFPLSVANNKQAKQVKQAKLGFAVSSHLEDVLSEVGVEIVDRSLAASLKNKLALAESKGKSKYKGEAIADYAVTGEILDANLTSRFHKRRIWEDDDGDLHEVAPYCRFETEVSAKLKVYILPELKFAKTIPVSGTASMDSETTNSRCPISNTTGVALLKKAAKDAIHSHRDKFQNFFAPKAYVLERREKEGENIFKLSSGTKLGFKGEADVAFYTMKIKTNPITGEITHEEYPVAKGTVATEPSTEGFSWVIIDDDEKANKIKFGDYVGKKRIIPCFGDTTP